MKLFNISNGLPVGRFLIFVFFSTCCASLASAQSFGGVNSFSNPYSYCLGQKKHSNEFTDSCQPDGIFYCDPLMLNGEKLNYFTFGLASQGELKLIKGETKSGRVVEIPYYVHLRRNGLPVTTWCGEGVIFSSVEISAILKVAQHGDELIIEPVNQEDWPAKRIIKIGDKC